MNTRRGFIATAVAAVSSVFALVVSPVRARAVEAKAVEGITSAGFPPRLRDGVKVSASLRGYLCRREPDGKSRRQENVALFSNSITYKPGLTLSEIATLVAESVSWGGVSIGAPEHFCYEWDEIVIQLHPSYSSEYSNIATGPSSLFCRFLLPEGLTETQARAYIQPVVASELRRQAMA